MKMNIKITMVSLLIVGLFSGCFSPSDEEKQQEIQHKTQKEKNEAGLIYNITIRHIMLGTSNTTTSRYYTVGTDTPPTIWVLQQATVESKGNQAGR